MKAISSLKYKCDICKKTNTHTHTSKCIMHECTHIHKPILTTVHPFHTSITTTTNVTAHSQTLEETILSSSLSLHIHPLTTCYQKQNSPSSMLKLFRTYVLFCFLVVFSFTTVLSQWDFSQGKFRLPSPGKPVATELCDQTYGAC